MAHNINDSCVNCGSCVSNCSFDAISEKDGKHWIDPEKCQDCGVCVESCPTEAISAG